MTLVLALREIPLTFYILYIRILYIAQRLNAIGDPCAV